MNKIQQIFSFRGNRFINMKGLSKPLGSPTNNPEKIFENKIEDMLLSAKQLASRLSCSVSYIKKLKREGKIIPEICFPRYVRYNYSSVVASLKRRGKNT